MFKIRNLSVGLVILAFGLAAFAQKTAITHESMWALKRVGAPIPSPDGKWVLFSLTEPAYDEKDQTVDLWIVPADGSAKPRRLTSTKAGEGGAEWSPDGTRIAFSAKRETDEVNQIYILDIGGGEAVRATNISTGARNPRWRPDGKAILFISSVFPGAGNDDDNKKLAKEKKDRKYKARVYDSFPVRNWDKWIDEMQTHVLVQGLEDGAKPKDLLAGTKLAAEKGFGGRIGSGSDDIDAAWSPDGQSVVFIASTDRVSAAFSETTLHLYSVKTSGGEPKQLTGGAATYGRPTFSPDGKTLYALHEPIGPKVYNLTRLAEVPWPGGGDPKVLTQGFDRAVGNFAFSPDSRTVYFTGEDSGHEKVYKLDVDDGRVFTVVESVSGCYTNLAVPAKASSTALFLNWDSAANPPEIVRVDDPVSALGQKFLTDVNKDALARIDMKPVQHFWFKSKAGKRIHNMYVTPPDFDPKKKYPLLVVMHGGPHSQWRDNWGLRWNYHLLAAPGYVVLLTNYTGSTGFGEKFAQDIQGDPFLTPANEINEAADEAIRQFPFIDGTRQAAAGASYGGHLANWMEATTTRYKALVAHAGSMNLESQWGSSDIIYSREKNNGGPPWEQGKPWTEQNPIRMAKNFKTPILVTVGENDFRVPLNQSLENWAALQRMKVPGRLIVFPEENHWILKGENGRFFYTELHGWLKKWL